MKGGSFITATRKPLIKPQNVPHAMPANDCHGQFRRKAVAEGENWPMTTDESTMMAPTERSMPAVRMTSDWAAARMPTI
jgi:hypothetical protein